MGARGSWARQLFPQGLLTARQSLPQVSHPVQLEHWGGVEETEASPPALPPSLPPWSRPPKGHTDAHPGLAPPPSKPQLEPLPPRATRALPAQDPLLKPAFPWRVGRRFPQHLNVQWGLPAWGR